MSDIIIKNSRTLDEYSIPLVGSFNPEAATTDVELPAVNGIYTVRKDDSSATVINITAAATWSFSTGLDYALYIEGEAAVFYCDVDTKTYYKIN